MSLTRINANIQALKSLNAFTAVNKKIEDSQTRLATGKRINSAGDDPAGYNLSRSLESRRRGLSTALDNVNNAKNVLTIAEGGYSNVMDILQTLKEKASQASDGTLNSTQRTALNDQVSALISEIDDIVSETTFNDASLIDGTFATTFQTGENATDSLSVTLLDSDSAALGINSISLSTQASATAALSAIDSAINTLATRTQDVGEYQARLNAKDATLSVAITNTESIRSTLEDADFAKEQVDLLKYNILQQTSLSSLAQANQAPNAVLSLFG
ncbi:MAG TPA: flagellin [Calditrichia bacterium]|nr:flagellin [Calditrichota bacterium]HQU72907.1 flagellin [Calditrichia bacterium]HQV32400.1 flagellin [Calditrichia bacterium]